MHAAYAGIIAKKKPLHVKITRVAFFYTYILLPEF